MPKYIHFTPEHRHYLDTNMTYDQALDKFKNFVRNPNLKLKSPVFGNNPYLYSDNLKNILEHALTPNREVIKLLLDIAYKKIYNTRELPNELKNFSTFNEAKQTTLLQPIIESIKTDITPIINESYQFNKIKAKKYGHYLGMLGLYITSVIDPTRDKLSYKGFKNSEGYFGIGDFARHSQNGGTIKRIKKTYKKTLKRSASRTK